TVTTAAVNGVVTALPMLPATTRSTSLATVSAPPPLRLIPATTPVTANVTTDARIRPTRVAPTVGHHRPRTNRRDRPRARRPGTPSNSSTGLATSHEPHR